MEVFLETFSLIIGHIHFQFLLCVTFKSVSKVEKTFVVWITFQKYYT